VQDELGQLAVRQLDTGTLDQDARLGLVHRQIVDTDLHDRSSGAEGRQRDWRLAPGGEHELAAGGDVDRELGDGVAALVVVEQLRVVEHQRDRIDHPRHGGCDATGDRRRHRRARRRPGPQDIDVDRLDTVEGCGDVGQEHGGVVVLVLYRHPGHAPRGVVGPLAQQRRLAVPGRTDDRDDRCIGRGAQPTQQAGAAYRARSRRRRPELRLLQEVRRPEPAGRV
jgi:hypothetical protein